MEATVYEGLTVRDRLVRLGQTMHGEKWQTPMSFDLWEVTGRRVQPQDISRWQAGVKPIPEWMDAALADCAVLAVERLERSLAEVRRLYPGTEYGEPIRGNNGLAAPSTCQGSETSPG